jgi:hypothetical protein
MWIAGMRVSDSAVRTMSSSAEGSEEHADAVPREMQRLRTTLEMHLLVPTALTFPRP